MVPRIMVTGLPGVGKTTLTSHSQIQEMEIRVVSFGKEMVGLGKTQKLIKNEKDIESLEFDKRVTLQIETAEKILSITDLPVIIDGHLIVDTPAGIIPGLPQDCISKLSLKAIIQLTAPDDEIIRRREGRSKKYSLLREWTNVERVKQNKFLLSEACLYYALLSDASFEVVENPKGFLEEKTLVRFIELLRIIIPSLDCD